MIQRPRLVARGDPFESRDEPDISKKTTIMGLPYGEEIVIVGHVDTVHECDRRTDRIRITKTAQRMPSRGKNVFNIVAAI